MRTIGYALCAIGAAIAVGGRVFHVVAHPEWTEPQALRALWVMWAVVVVCIVLGAWLLRGKW